MSTTALEPVIITKAETLEALNRSETSILIETAKKYPRHLPTVLNTIQTLATMDKETAEDCFYVLRRKGADGESNIIEGLSVRMAEIILAAYGNMRVQARTIANDGKTITVQAVALDLESNVGLSLEVTRRITDRNGKTYSVDMQEVTQRAAVSIARRNAILAIIPKAITKRIIDDVKKVAMGQSIDLEQGRQNMLAYYAKLGVSKEMIFSYLNITSINEIDADKIFELRATRNAIAEGTATAQGLFITPYNEAKAAEQEVKKAATAKDKADVAMAKAKGGKSTQAEAEPELTLEA